MTETQLIVVIAGSVLILLGLTLAISFISLLPNLDEEQVCEHGHSGCVQENHKQITRKEYLSR